MGCMSLGMLEQICILIVVIIAVWRVFVLLAPYLAQFLPALVIALIQIAVWLMIAIFAIKIIFELLECVFGSGGLSLGIHR